LAVAAIFVTDLDLIYFLMLTHCLFAPLQCLFDMHFAVFGKKKAEGFLSLLFPYNQFRNTLRVNFK